jgi:type 1 glutamine amidotransferase
MDQPAHAALAGLKEFTIRDELWNRPGIVAGATVLASAYSDKQQEARGTDQWEPSVVVAKYGEGRCFATLLGHDATVMENASFRRLLVQGVTWTARGAAADAANPDTDSD